ncbi:MAG: hypothetical protein KDE27_21365 [Planctomycetes bacterium]|nr:hypothetical protein [Planctomycetota bacterium]
MADRSIEQAGKGLGWGAFLAGLIPGLLQFQLGQKQRAITALVSCTVLFFAGWSIVGERLFYWTLVVPDASTDTMRGLARVGFPLVLPELLNLPANAIGAILAFDGSPTGERLWRMPRDFEHIAGWLTAASGMLAAFWAAAGHWQLRLRRDGGASPRTAIADPALCAALSWLLPGLGHARAGQKDKGMLMGAAVVIVFALGLVFSHGHAVDRATASVWWIGQNLFGGGTLFAALVTSPLQMESAPANLDLGVVLCTVAGLMNLVVMVDAFTVAERSAFPLARRSPAGAASVATEETAS